MPEDIKKILFATDLSARARHAFEYAARLACRQGATIVLLHVMEEATAYTSSHLKGFLGEDRWQELKKSQEDQARRILIGKKREGAMIKEAIGEFCRIAKSELGEQNVPTDEIIVSKGSVVDEIMAEAERSGCDLIVMGHYPRGKVGEAVVGSTTRKVLRYSRIPILLVPLPEE